MMHDPENTLKPLRAVEGDVIALRTGGGGAGAVVRIARAAEAVLRRMLRDDPTAPVELRLRALSGDDLATGELLAELRRRERLPMELAAAFHELTASANRLATQGGDATPRDGEVAVAAADGLERHILSNPYDSPLQDPVLPPPPEQTLIPPAPQDRGGVRAVPTVDRARPPVWPWIAGALAILVLAGVAFTLLRGRGGDPVADGETALSRGDTAGAFRLFAQASQKDPKAPGPHYYMAHIYRVKGRPQDAARELRAGLDAAPGDAKLNAELGWLMLDQGQAAGSVDRFRQAVVLDSMYTPAWTGLVTALRRSGRADQATRVISRAPAAVRGDLLSLPPDTVQPAMAQPVPGAAPGTAPVPAPSSAYPPDTTGTVRAPVAP
jgi:tetratricopeptide (TPR) repeat protein